MNPIPFFSTPMLDIPPKHQLRIPLGFTLLMDAVEQVGKCLFGEEWTGQEQRARSNLGVRPAGPTIMRPPVFDGNEPSIALTYYAVPALKERPLLLYPFLRDADEAQREWEKVRDPIWAAYDAEAAARARRGRAVTTIRDPLSTGALVALFFDPEPGFRTPAPAQFWDSALCAKVFELGADDAKWLNPNFISGLGHAVLRTEDLDKLLAENSQERSVLEVSRSVEPVASARRRSPTPCDEAAFKEMVADARPSRREMEAWAKERGLSREWARTAIRQVPADQRKKLSGGDHKPSGR